MLPREVTATFNPTEVYAERGISLYPQGRELLDRYHHLGLPVHEIDDHSRIPALREQPDEAFTAKKRVLVLGVRKSLRLLPNERSADWIVPFTSSGCPAMCLYCYLTCTFFSNSYLRIFVNRDEMWQAIMRKHEGVSAPTYFELGSNSDLVVENEITGNLPWIIERFSFLHNGYATFATKFAAIDPLLDVDHRGHTRVRISVNPEPVIKRVEIGTAPLGERIRAANRLHAAGYQVGLNIAPVILTDGWRDLYSELIRRLARDLSPGITADVPVEVIFMTYGVATEKINRAAFREVPDLLDRGLMRPKGRGKYCYRAEYQEPAATFLLAELRAHMPGAKVLYVC